MKKIYLLLITSLIFLSSKAQTELSVTDENDISAIEKKGHEGLFRSLLSGVVNNYDIVYHRCEWQIDPAVRYIKGAVTSYFKPKINSFNQIQFDLSDSLTVDSVKYHNSSLLFSQLPNDLLQINFSSILSIGVVDSITIYYKGIPPNTGFGSFVQSSHLGAPIIWTLSEPFGAKDWWPCKQDLVDKIDSIEVIVTMPQGNKAASNGILLSETQSGVLVTDHWKTKYPTAAYLVAIGVTNYFSYSNIVPLPTRYLNVLNYVYPEYAVPCQIATPDIINVIVFYDSLLITYPFQLEKYGHCQFGWGGGMEHQTMSFVNGFNHALMAHECAHQWFGDWVTCGSWQDIWLNEGFATFLEGLTEERFFNSTWLGWKQNKIAVATSQVGGSVLCDDTTSVNRIFSGQLSYDKGSYLLMMLRWKLGDAAFFQGLKDYLNDPLLGGHYAHTPDLKAHLETASGQNLTSFFNEWYYNQGYPSYHLLWSQSGTTVTLTVNQSTSHPSVPFYELPIPVKFIGASQDTTIVFNHTSSGQVFMPNINFPVVDVQFDPDLHILSANNTVTGIPNVLPLSNDILVYPNPVKNNISLSIQLKVIDELTYELFDITGKTVFSKTETVTAGSSLRTINTDNLAKGEYVLRVKGKIINYSTKIIKQ